MNFKKVTKNGLIGGTTGTVLGIATYLAVGTLGVATGGSGIALGLFGQTAIGSIVGTISGIATEVVKEVNND